METTHTPPAGDRVQRAREALAANEHWYHTIDLAPGVASPGHVDWREAAARILPDDLSGRRALDVGTFDGFWAFEMEQRGAEVVAIDVEAIDGAEWPPLHRESLQRTAAEWDIELGRGFRLAHELRGSSVRRVVCNVYDLTPDAIGGPVDFAFLGALLLHLRDPVRALEHIRGALAPGGDFLAVECVSMRAQLVGLGMPIARFEPTYSQFNWWRPNVRGLISFVEAAGFHDVKRKGRLLRPPGKREMRTWYCALTAKP
jgi:SAM-dependent methyltransferase